MPNLYIGKSFQEDIIIDELAHLCLQVKRGRRQGFKIALLLLYRKEFEIKFNKTLKFKAKNFSNKN